MVRIGRAVAVSLTYNQTFDDVRLELAEAKPVPPHLAAHFPAASKSNRAEEPAILAPRWLLQGAEKSETCAHGLLCFIGSGTYRVRD